MKPNPNLNKSKMNVMKNRIIAMLLLLSVGIGLPGAQGAAFTAFTYQGRLSDASAPANGWYDFEFKLFDGANSATQRGATLSQPLVAVSNGLFTVILDFGAQFDGGERWLQIDVQSNGVPPFMTLAPRQQITSAPYAIYTDRAGLADVANQALSVGINGVSTTSLQPEAVTGAKIANGNVVRSVNGLTDALNLAAGANITLGTVGNTLTISGSSAWLLNGNGGTDPVNNFLGTTDNLPLTLRVNNQPVLRLEPDISPRLIGGHSANQMTLSGIWGGTIGGGGTALAPNLVTDDYGTVGGGAGNRAGNANGIIDDANHSTVGGGLNNIAGAPYSTVSGGNGNKATGQGAVVSGGSGNAATNSQATVGGGINNIAGAPYSAIGGGNGNKATGQDAVVSGGSGNAATNGQATVGGGIGNNALGSGSTVGGGYTNLAGALFSTVGGGGGNKATGQAATVGGGSGNAATNSQATVGGGIGNLAGAPYSTVGGGNGNKAMGQDAVVSGGSGNAATNGQATVSGGIGNIAGAPVSTVGGGQLNLIGPASVGASIGGGQNNAASGQYAMIPGGRENQAFGNYDFTAGYRAQSTNNGTFVWSDGTGTGAASSVNNQFVARASGGFVFYTGTGSSGAQLAADGTSWAVISDRNVKKDFAPLDGRRILEKLAALPITQWHYQWEAPEVTPHIGPMAQDFKAAFYPGTDDKSITTQEADGVALAAIQGLNQKLEETRAENAALKLRLEKLERLMNRPNGGAR
jgi:trimeric autotransporter adhesin